MGLPPIGLPTGVVNVGGVDVPVRGLSRSEAIILKTKYDVTTVDEADDFILSKGTGVTMEEAHAWREDTDVITAGKVIDQIVILSGLAEDAGKGSNGSSSKVSSALSTLS